MPTAIPCLRSPGLQASVRQGCCRISPGFDWVLRGAQGVRGGVRPDPGARGGPAGLLPAGRLHGKAEGGR